MAKHPDIDAFFMEPNQPHAGPEFSTLYLLRRDIRLCLGQKPEDGSATDYKVIWPGTMATLAGVDLLGKFLAGQDTIGEVGKRFRAFITRYFGLSAGDEEVVYQLRNGLLHSFGLYSTSHGKPYKFLVLDDGTKPVVDLHAKSGRHIIDLRSLYRIFEGSIAQYRKDVASIPDIETRFHAMYQRYGRRWVGPLDEFPPGF
jgi:hypothetical protein